MKVTTISAVLTAAQMQTIVSALASIREEMPFLVSLTPGERRSFAGVGDSSRGFIQKALDIATHNQDMLPRSFDVEEMRKDVELGAQLEELQMLATQLQQMLADTKLVVNKESYTAARTVYTAGKLHGKDTALTSALEDLGRRYHRRPNNSNTNNSGTAEGETKE